MALVNRYVPHCSNLENTSSSSVSSASTNSSSNKYLNNSKQKSPAQKTMRESIDTANNKFSFDKQFKFPSFGNKTYSQSTTESFLAEKPLFSSNKKPSRSENLINGILHSTAKSGKIAKRKNEKKVNPKNLSSLNMVQCFNLAEREKFRKLLSQNCQPFKYEAPSSSLRNSENAYQKLIHSSPDKIRDDISFDSKYQQKLFNKGEISFEKSNLTFSNLVATNAINSPLKVSLGYSRRISLSSDFNADSPKSTTLNSFKSTNGVLKNTSNNLNKSSNNNTRNGKNFIEEIDISEVSTLSPSVVVAVASKSAQKRHNAQQIDENEQQTACMEKFQKETQDYYTSIHVSNQQKTHRNTSEKEKVWKEKLDRNQNLLEEILKKSHTKSAALAIEEERYKMKKRQRLEREKAEQELVQKFSQSLYLDASKLAGVYVEEEEIEIEDEFPELSEEQESVIKNALMNHQPEEVMINAFNINITRKDIQTLRGLNWLNDDIINFYMSLICERSEKKEDPNLSVDYKIYAFSTFFYPKLLKDGYPSLRRWTRKVDVFSYNIILVPVHLGLHWTLAVIDFECREIRYYDSMNGNNGECLKILRSYLKDEYADKKSGAQFDLSNWSCIHVKNVPQQMNGSDCGMFTCKYAEYISRGKTTFSFNQSHMPYFRRRMIWEILNKKLM